MKNKIKLFVTILLLAFSSAYAQLTYPPISVGDLSDLPNYTYTANTADHPHGYIHQAIILPETMDVSISHCGSTLNASEFSLCDNNLKGTAQSGSTSAGSDNNYVLTITPTVATSDVSSLSADGALRTYQYFDGLGRPMQTVQQRITPGKTDLATYQEYDAFGRESNSWLPAKVATNTGAFVPLATVKTGSSSTYGDAMAYSRVEYEASPLNRVTGQTGPGADWHNNSKKVATEYLANNDTYVCRWYRASDTRTNSQVSIASGAVNYPAGELYVTKLTDEDSNISYEFKDKLGQVLLTRQMEGNVAHDTYYVYDSYGNLRAVLPPLAADAMNAAGSWAETHATIMNYAYLYKYDSRNRCIAKKLPGADWVYYVYDYADRLIYTQDGEMRAQNVNQWIFSLPDAFGRVVLTGTCINPMNYATDPLGTTVVRATRTPVPTTNPYKGHMVSGVTFSLATIKILSVNYYDDYNFMNANDIPDSNHVNVKYETISGYGTRYTGGYKGLLTGTMSAQLNQSGEITSYLYSVMYYDDRGRVIQVKSNNHLTGGVEKEYIGYNFSGQPVKRRLEHSATGKATQTQLYEYTYDHAGRLTQVKHGLNTSTAGTVIALNTYDDLGRLKTQKKGSLPETTYGYNVRSWTKTIANNTLFSQTLYYNESYGVSAKRYNGNVSATSWKVGSETLRGYALGYDGLSRLTSASYLLGGVANSNNSVSGITYDKHGNMKTIQRRGKITASAYGVIDNLTMAYSGNQLTGVTDAGSTVTLAESNDFKKGSTAATQYFYNRNGAMDKDLNKNISDISYNLLNLPSQVTIGGVAHKYTYSADGRKLRVEQGTTNRDYVGSVIYENGSLKRVLIDGGYIEGGVYYYYLNDHLGNVRVVASGTGTVHQKNEYYPFGMPMAETANSQQEVQPYKFGGKEFERKGGLNLMDFGARNYDAALGRFTTMDRFAEKYYSQSPYQYTANNPMRYIDVNGDSISLGSIMTVDQSIGTNITQKIIDDSESLTGLTLLVGSNGGVTYKVDSNGQPVITMGKDSNGNNVQLGSATARDLLINAIDHPDWVNVVLAQASGVAPGTNELRLSYHQINSFINGANGLDNRTMGWGMTFLHELHHTQVGGGLSDFPGNPGPVVTQMNIIRSELNALGGNYGQRMDYIGTRIGTYGYLPFDVNSQRLINNSIVPIRQEKFIKFR